MYCTLNQSCAPPSPPPPSSFLKLSLFCDPSGEVDDPHSNRRSRGQLRTKIECGEGTIPVKSRNVGTTLALLITPCRVFVYIILDLQIIKIFGVYMRIRYQSVSSLVTSVAEPSLLWAAPRSFGSDSQS